MKQKSKNVKLVLPLSEEEKEKVKQIMNKGKASARIFKRARVLELFDEGLTSPTISRYVGVTAETLRRIGWNYVKGGLKQALYDSPRLGGKKKVSQDEETRIVALVCSDPPEGYDRWTVRLLTEEVKKKNSGINWERDDTGYFKKPWYKTMAGKKCGVWRSLMMNILNVWKIYCLCAQRIILIKSWWCV